MKRILIIGASSFIGANLAVQFRKEHHVLGTFARHKPFLDGVPLLRFPLGAQAPIQPLIRRLRPDIVIYCAGPADDRQCREDPMGTLFLHADAPALFAEALIETPGRLIVFSSSKVFSGEKGGYSEGDPVSPTTVYGSAKVRGEEMLLQYENTFVLRLGNTFGWSPPQRPTFVQRLLTDMWGGRSVSLICDEFRNFLGVDQLSHCLEPLFAPQAPVGLYHLSDGTKMSHYHLGRLVAQTFGLPVSLLKPVTGAEFSRERKSREARGDDLSLNGTLFSRTFGRAPQGTDLSMRRIRDRLHLGRQ